MLLSDNDVDDYGNDYNDGVGGDDRKDIGLSFFFLHCWYYNDNDHDHDDIDRGGEE